MRISNDTIILAPVDMSSNWTSEPFWLGHLKDFSVQLVFSGSPLGIFRLRCSNDREINVEGAQGVQNFTLIAGSTQAVEEAGDHTWAVYNAGYRWVQVQWMAGIGSSGMLQSARINGKGA